ncbi:helix-turn-helix domain-containing protein [Brevibacillus reuszeri]|uniref:helix-turn-helix domain-containing protein n=1 Tax=Brevibacillus reuszeri TaxID=54915 RepID=UPI0013DFADFE|nr:helix-turn-helix domain-containing protein [Brevibacillus reuszeri]
MTLGEKLKKLRETHRWTQGEAAKRLGISSQVVSNYERDYRSPDKDTLSKIATVYECSLDWLLGLSDDPNPIRPTGIKNDIVAEPSAEYDYRSDPTVSGELRELLDTLVTLPENERKRIIEQALVFAAGLKAKNQSSEK